jgi:ubiquinone/menaquinone biosynthesis C-methylase UbiE
MPIDFHSEHNSQTYASRRADPAWAEMINRIVDIRGKAVADIGCGGGIYSRALAEMGADHVTCIDWSQVMLTDAQNSLADCSNIGYVQGEALNTGIADEQFDLVLERALIHHVQTEIMQTYFAEVWRVLKPGGVFIVQDRTVDDCLLPGSQTHIRGYFFSCYPRLIPYEVDRRQDSQSIQQALRAVGFQQLTEQHLWEIRQIHPQFSDLAEDLLARTGRSILHDLTAAELLNLIDYIRKHIGEQTSPIVEQDCWTIWSAVRQ